MSGSFCVSLAFYIANEETRRKVEQQLPELKKERPLFESAGLESEWWIGLPPSVDFSSRFVDCRDRLLELVSSQTAHPEGGPLVVISDQLTESDSGNKYVPSQLVHEICRASRSPTEAPPEHPFALIALVDGRPRKTTEIYATVDVDDAALPPLKEAVTRAKDALWLKSRVPPQPMEEGRSIVVRLARTPPEIQTCLNLRFEIYSTLGYLGDRISRCPKRMELDCYDDDALHLCAIDRSNRGAIAGTLRFVLRRRDEPRAASRDSVPRELDFAQTKSLDRVRYVQGEWIKEVASNDAVLHRRLGEQNSLTHFPIMGNTDVGDLWPDFLDKKDDLHTAEISRVVVSPGYRGLHVSTLLMRAAIAMAHELDLRFLVLECIPSHQKMYKKYKFQPLPTHCRARDLDQAAVAMKLDLESLPMQCDTMATAKRDLDYLRKDLAAGEVILGRRGLCLCQLTECWKRGRYDHRGSPICPLAAPARAT